jgi:hypothetical protein
MKAKDLLMSHQELIDALTAACVAALKAGLTDGDVSCALARLQELVEQSDDV